MRTLFQVSAFLCLLKPFVNGCERFFHAKSIAFFVILQLSEAVFSDLFPFTFGTSKVPAWGPGTGKISRKGEEEKIMNKKTQKDIATAAEAYRLIQAEELIRSCRETIEVDGKKVEVPVFVLTDPETSTYVLNPILAAQEADKPNG